MCDSLLPPCSTYKSCFKSFYKVPIGLPRISKLSSGEEVSYCELSRLSNLLPSYSDLLRREYLTGKPSEIPTIAPAIVKFTPDVKESRAVLLEDVKNWRSQPNELVGNCFISTDMVRRVFVVDDYSVKYRKGATYDILYEDLGLDEVESIDPETLLEMVADSELVLNALPRF